MQNRLLNARTKLLLNAPFYGTLLMRLNFALAPCGTACTDMKRIYFDPEFLKQLSEEQLLFVLKHEVLHCVLQHGSRARGFHTMLYNIAADIVVNSTLLEAMNVKEFEVLGERAMHLTPNGKEGRYFTTEQVYEMLLNKYKDELDNPQKISEKYGDQIDDHRIWGSLLEGTSLEEEWKEFLKVALGDMGPDQGMPPAVRQFAKQLAYESRVDWRSALQDFVQMTKSDLDYTFSPPDKRFRKSKFFLPAFNEIEEETIDDIWFVIDTSGSIDNKQLTELFEEMRMCVEQFPNISVKISFFDTKVHGVTEFHTEYQEIDWKSIVPVGGGGTSFHCIFKYMKEHMKEELPTAVVILTDGYAAYPKKEDAMGVPVLWILTSWGREEAPWGKTVYL